ncbi:type-1 angiotensin II receptor B-like [Strongylocentrotus purpuratus]|uniref:G-protein coupled receptors family 1 profile domain-containing protein n=1 Tax=Strongylocentrotus purpuratus TaxID=7668 RepID=A0A7M7P6D8_STRPU|nr:type-1 angiotensin II receptor B-like [Strongylocentrotus purpuratus]
MPFTNYSIIEDFDVGWTAGRIENSAFVRTIYGLIAFCGITGNALVCFVLLRVPALRTRTSHFIINLAVNDLATSLLVIPFHLFMNFPPAPSGLAGQLYCRLFISKAVLWASIVASACSLVAVTAERYFAVVHPIRYKLYFTPRLAIIVVVSCWVFAILLCFYHMFSYKPSNGFCIFIPFSNRVDQMPINFPIFLDGEAVINKDRWQFRAADDMQKTLWVVVLFYVLCWGPNHFLFLAFTLGARVDFTSQYYHFTVIIALFNSCVNPFIYVFKNKAFRRGVLQAFRLPPGRASIHPAASGSGTGTGVSTGVSTVRDTGSTIN